jgi:hypothetical protein
VQDSQVVVLGGGITGCLTACLLADAGLRVLIVEQRDRLLDGASRWNDGKVHLGYTFTGTESLATAALLQRGAAAFFPVLERVLGGPLPAVSVASDGVIYLVDQRSMVDATTLWERAQAVSRLLAATRAAHPGLKAYPGIRYGPPQRIPAGQAELLTGQTGVAAAWRVPEAHCAARVLADRIDAAVEARPIDVLQARVQAVEPAARGWRIRLEDGDVLHGRVVVNCTWEGRAAIDRRLCPDDTPISIRYKYALFGERVRALADVPPSTRILGRFGDVVRFADGDAYLSWYPASLVARSDDGTPPPIPPLDPAAMTRAILDGLGLPGATIEDSGASWRVRGGYVVAHGHGDIDRRESPLHARDHVGVTELRPGYLTVDTGKLTFGPLFASQAALAAARHLGVEAAA